MDFCFSFLQHCGEEIGVVRGVGRAGVEWVNLLLIGNRADGDWWSEISLNLQKGNPYRY